MPENKLIIFVKNEEVGKVKTRLAESIGDRKALQVYQGLVKHTHSVTLPLKVNKEVWYSIEVEHDDVWSKGHFKKKVQMGSDLGHKMAYAFEDAFQNGATKVAIIGSDNAEITSDVLEKAFIKLDETDIVIGPAKDGGYYLLGMNRYHPQLFEGVEWSTEEVLQTTINIIEQLGLTYTKLKPLNDVDTIEDWVEVKDQLMKGLKEDV